MYPSSRRSAVPLQLLVLGSLAPAALYAQSAPAADAPRDRARPAATAAERSGAVRIDGHLDEEAWAAATPVTEFTQQRPSEGAPASEKTEVRILFDDDALYIGGRMYDSEGEAGVRSRLVRRDQPAQSDALRIDFDTYRDRLYSVQFVVNPAGWRADAAGPDWSWDPVWEVGTRVDSLGWTAEIRIPFSQLRFSREPLQTWGMNITRVVYRKQERSQWSFWRQNEPGGPAFFGELAGLRIERRPRHAELLPYVVARNERLASGDPDSPFNDSNSGGVRVGGDLTYGLTSNLTLSATVNPDFGQVEVDPAVVNLSAFETFFQEKRPFFVEGSSLFDFGQPGCYYNCGWGLNLFYSRRVGRAPRGSRLAFAAGPYADIPENTSILGAAKLTGRTASGYTVGLLNAVTRREVARVATEDGGRLFQPVEPLTNSFVGRVRREMSDGDLALGAIGTAVNRDLDDAGLASLLPSNAQSVGADAEYFWGDRTYRLYAALAASHVGGDSAAIRRLQNGSAHYLQRPDREPASNGLFTYGYDPTATSLTGYGGIARLSKEGGDWIWDLNAASVSPGFGSNDLGFQQIADWRWANAGLARRFTRPTRYYRTMTAWAGTNNYWNYEGDNTRRDVGGWVDIELPNYWTLGVDAVREFSTLSDRLTRGGPVVRDVAKVAAGLRAGSDPRRRVALTGSVLYIGNDEGGSEESGRLEATFRPASNVSLSLGPGFSRMNEVNQYVTSVADPTATAFFGRRYVFATLDQTQVYMNTRANVNFTPSLSLELFAQPLLASGAYHRFQEFAAPRGRQKRVYGRDAGTVTATDGGYRIDPDGVGPAIGFNLSDPDFNLRSLRGTGVLRWEWRPGSTAYLVWTQRRSDTVGLGDFDFGRDQAALFRAPADNVFALKVSYWVGL